MAEEVKRYMGMDFALEGESIGVITCFKATAEGKSIHLIEQVAPLAMAGPTTFEMNIKNLWVDHEYIEALYFDGEIDRAPPREFSP